MMRARWAAGVFVFLFSSAPQAILIRADRDDAEYLELATRYTSSVRLDAVDGEGVLIAPRWLLTAASKAKALRDLKALPRLRLGEREHEIQSISLHPGWKEGGENDLALILLKDPVRGVEPTRLYREGDEGGKTLVIVGHGETGTIGAKPLPRDKRDRKKRAGINTVDRVGPRLLGLQVKKADDASDLQGMGAAGDIGGPAYIQTDDGLFVAGIGNGIDDSDWERYTRVSAFVPWIEGVMLEEAKLEAEKLLGDARR